MLSHCCRSSDCRDLQTDFIIVGSGISGLYTAIRLSSIGRVVVLSKQDLTAGNTWFAQGGIAAVAGDDSPDLHYQDTWEAGAKFGDPKAISVLVNEAPLCGRGGGSHRGSWRTAWQVIP